MSLRVEELKHDQVRSGTLRCESKGCEYPISKYVPRFVDADQYAGSFSVQRHYVRKHFRHYREDRSGYDLFFPTTGFDQSDLQQGLILEAGCGYGRFLDVVQHHGGAIVGVDLSTHSIDLAQDFVGLKERVHLVQCDVFHLPFRKEYFKRIYSVGVLHHTPDTRRAFEAIVPYLSQAGKISIWVYHPHSNASVDRWRKVTTRIPHQVLYAFCILNQILFAWIRGLPGGWRFSWIIPGDQVGQGRAFWLRVIADFDALSPQYAHVHTEDEVKQWFLAAGLHIVKILDRPTSVTGSKL